MIGKIIAVTGIVLILIGIVIAYPMMYAFTTGEETITIKDKWVKYQGDSAKYLVSSEDGQVFQITDSIVNIRFDSSNLYAQLDKGDVCLIKTQGWRFPLFSDYKNIIEADCE